MQMAAKEHIRKDTAGALAATGVQIKKKDLNLIRPEDLTLIFDPAHPLYDPRVDDDPDPELVEDIRERGILAPIIARKNGTHADGKGRIEVVAGRNRVKAALKLRDEGVDIWVPYVARQGSDLEMVLIMASENANRKDETLFSQAFKAKRALDLGATRADVSKAFGCAQATVDLMITFLDLSKKAQKVFEDRELPIGAIKEIAAVPREEQQAVIEKLKEQGLTKTHEVAAGVRAVRSGSTYEKPDTKKMLTRKQLERWMDQLNETQGKSATIAYAVLKTVLGYNRALGDFPELKPSKEVLGRRKVD